MWTDPIVEESRQFREAYAAKFNYDLEAICLDIKRQELESGREFVCPPAKRPGKEAEISVQGIQGVDEVR
jgi:hypothetical protein